MRAGDRLRDLDEKSARLQMLVAEQRAHRRDRCEWHPPRLHLFVEIQYSMLADVLLEHRAQRVPVCAAQEAVGEDIHACPFGIAHHVDEVLPLMLLDAARVDVAVLGLEGFRPAESASGRAGRDHFHVRPVLEGQLQLRRDGFLHGRVDVLAFAVAQPREQRAHRRDRAMHSALEPRLRSESPKRRQVGMLGTAAIEDAYAAGRPDREILGAPVAIRSFQTPWRDRGHDELRIDFLQAIVRKPDAIHLGRNDVVNQDVGAGDELLENLEALGSRNIERDAELVGVEVKEQAGFFRMRLVLGKRAAAARAIADARALDLDNLGAHIGHQLGRIGRGDQLAELDNFYVRKCSCHLLSSGSPSLKGRG